MTDLRCVKEIMNLGRGLELLHRAIIEWAQDPDRNKIVAESAAAQMLDWIRDMERCGGVEMPITKSLCREVREYARTSSRAENVGVSLEVFGKLKSALYEELKGIP
ncbi:MAG: hypothetical protein JRE40_10145, partial [Deltaproteobacteria bacterium]|nr:hypothetical protein [Deltaproteobacteria bacterium]